MDKSESNPTLFNNKTIKQVKSAMVVKYTDCIYAKW